MYPVSISKNQVSFDGTSRLLTIPTHRDYRHDPIAEISFFLPSAADTTANNNSGSSESTVATLGHSAAFSQWSCRCLRSGAVDAAQRGDDDVDVADLMANPHEQQYPYDEDVDESRVKIDKMGSHVAFVVSRAAAVEEESPKLSKKGKSPVPTITPPSSQPSEGESWIVVVSADSMAFSWAVAVPSHLAVVRDHVLLLTSHSVLFIAKQQGGASSLFVAARPQAPARVTELVESVPLVGDVNVVSLVALPSADTKKRNNNNGHVAVLLEDGRVYVLTLPRHNTTGRAKVLAVQSFTPTADGIDSATSQKKSGKSGKTNAPQKPQQLPVMKFSLAHTSLCAHRDLSLHAPTETTSSPNKKQSTQQMGVVVLGVSDTENGKVYLASLSTSSGSVKFTPVEINNTNKNDESQNNNWHVLSIRPSYISTFAVTYTQASNVALQYVTVPMLHEGEHISDEELLVSNLTELGVPNHKKAQVRASWFDIISGSEFFIAVDTESNTNAKVTHTPAVWTLRLSCHYGAPGAKEMKETAWSLAVQSSSASETSASSQRHVDSSNSMEVEDGEVLVEEGIGAAGASQRFVYVYPLQLEQQQQGEVEQVDAGMLCLAQIRAAPRAHSKLLRQWPNAVQHTRLLIRDGALIKAFSLGTVNPALLRTSLRHCTSEELQRLFTDVISACKSNQSSSSFARRCTAAVDIGSQLITLHRQLDVNLSVDDVKAFCRLLRGLRTVGHQLGRAEVRLTAMLRHAASLASHNQPHANNSSTMSASSVFQRQKQLSVVGTKYTPLPWAQRVEADGTKQLEAVRTEASALLAGVRWGKDGVKDVQHLNDWEAVGSRMETAESSTLRCLEEPFVKA